MSGPRKPSGRNRISTKRKRVTAPAPPRDVPIPTVPVALGLELDRVLDGLLELVRGNFCNRLVVADPPGVVDAIAFGINMVAEELSFRRPGEPVRLPKPRLNLVLRAIRNVDQLIVKEKNRDALVDRACSLLVEA